MYISICGNIGSGKSTIINRLQKSNICANIQQEPIDEMKPLLEKFYKNMDKWCFTIQMYVLHLYKKYH
jgi:deoxyadenosine/deoxycytidine kinase